MKQLNFGKLIIGGPKTVIIAELADSHNGSIETAKKLVDAAKEMGADVAKFQIHLPDIEMVPGKVHMWDGDLYEILKRNLFTPEMHKEMMAYCEQVGIEYLCTPFCPTAVDVLNDLGVKAFKTGSGEIMNLPHHRKLAKISKATGKPVIVSTGMCLIEEIVDTVKVYEEEGAKDNLVLTNCTSEYPPNDYSHANLGLIKVLQDRFGVMVGQSDHTMDNYTAYASVALGAKVVEKHFTLDRNQKGPDHFISLEPHMLKELVDGIRKIEVGLGSEKTISKEEQVVRDWAFHSVIASRDIKAGEELSLENLMPKRPGSGIPAKYLDPMYSKALLGKKARHDLVVNDIVQWDDLS
ncbi:N-acetylneuraminate synthase family protein [Candidatus Kaiserbacteria bacterium]|nr:N-acetylneuraminate synthase family protein [Candidatus Kaiserbacteria bacterium]